MGETIMTSILIHVSVFYWNPIVLQSVCRSISRSESIKILSAI